MSYFIADFAKKKEPDLYDKSMRGWTRNNAILGGVTGAAIGTAYAPGVGTALGGVGGTIAGAKSGLDLGAIRNASRNIKKVAKTPQEEKKLRRARKGMLLGSLYGNPGLGSVVGAYTND